MHLKDPTPSRYHDIIRVWRETNCIQSIAGTFYQGIFCIGDPPCGNTEMRDSET